MLVYLRQGDISTIDPTVPLVPMDRFSHTILRVLAGSVPLTLSEYQVQVQTTLWQNGSEMVQEQRSQPLRMYSNQVDSLVSGQRIP